VSKQIQTEILELLKKDPSRQVSFDKVIGLPGATGESHLMIKKLNLVVAPNISVSLYDSLISLLRDRKVEFKSSNYLSITKSDKSLFPIASQLQKYDKPHQLPIYLQLTDIGKGVKVHFDSRRENRRDGIKMTPFEKKLDVILNPSMSSISRNFTSNEDRRIWNIVEIVPLDYGRLGHRD